MTFNLSAPIHFRGLHPDIPVHVYHRNLPYWRQEGATYFVTFRLADSIPQEKMRTLLRWRTVWEKQNPEPRDNSTWDDLARQITTRIERFLDSGFGSCFFRETRFAEQMSRSLLHFQNDRCFTSCFVVMPNHVHAVIKPLGKHKLENCLQRIKQFVARQINRELNKTGQLWAEESYDRIIRDEEHLWRTIQYIGKNPSKAGIPKSRWVRWICPDWEKVGWRLIDQ